jgi:hypothetical protein
MSSVRRSSAIVLAGLLAVGSISLTACGSSAKDAVTSAAAAASSAASVALDSNAKQQIDAALSDGGVKTKVCDAFKSNAEGFYQQAIDAINGQKAGAGDAISKVVSPEQLKSYLTEKCA